MADATTEPAPPEPAPPGVGAAEGVPGIFAIGRAGWATLRGVQKRLVRNRVSLSAGSLAYHWFLALFPAVIGLLGLLGLVHLGAGTAERLLHGIDAALPAGASTVVDGAVRAAISRPSGSPVVLVVGLTVALWSASSGAAALEQALDVAYEVPVDRTFLARRIRAVPIMAAVAVLGGASAALVVFGVPIGSAIDGHLPVHGVAFLVVWTGVRWAVTVLLVTLLFSVLYFLGPNRVSPTWRWVSPGGLLGTAVFLLASLGFSFYVSAFGSYGATYGSFAGVAILILWLYFTGFAILLGGELNAELEHRHG